ncbi:MAG: c-type cytochrome [Myxococcota bacterium]|nr:c-type cytochrome [Myxococcota bacterium]
MMIPCYGTHRRPSWLALTALFLASLACTSPPDSPALNAESISGKTDRKISALRTPPIIDQVGGRAAQIFRQRCVSCHGLSGDGQGVAARSLPVKPRAFTDAHWRSTVSNEHLKTVIVRGGAAVGQSHLMTANPDLKDQPDVVMGLIKIIRGL